MILTGAERAYLAGIIPAMESSLRAIKAAVQAGGPVTLADGRVWAPALETVTSYRTRETFDALEPVVGEALANDAAEYSGASIKAALAEAAEAGLPSMSFGKMRSELEARGAVVVTAREVWRKRWPATPVEVVTREDEDREEGVRKQATDRSPETERADAVQGSSVDRGGEAVAQGVRGLEAVGSEHVATNEVAAVRPALSTVKRANPLPATWQPSDALTRTLAGRTPPVIVENLMPEYRAAMAGQTAGRWTDARFARWLEERETDQRLQLAIEGA